MKRYLVVGGRSWSWQVYWAVFHDRVLSCGYASSEAGLTRLLSLEPLPRYLFFVHWSQKVPTSILERVECVNFHCTALPYGRGGHPIENLILRGHQQTIITAHRMTAEIDAGPIYGQSGPVSLAGCKDDILGRFVEPCADLMRTIIDTEPVPVPQVGTSESFFRLPAHEVQALWASR